MMTYVNRFLNNITMYKLVLYELAGLLLVASVFGALRLVPYAPYMVALSALYISAIAYLVHQLFAWSYDASSNLESSIITALILALIVSPPTSFTDTSYLMLATLATVVAITSKYVLTWRGAHVFNPAAFGVAYTALVLGLSASWWVATPLIAPFVLVGGALIVRKIRRADLIVGFAAGNVIILVAGALLGLHVVSLASTYQLLVLSPWIFFATVMLTEPITAPAERFTHVVYGLLIGILFVPTVHLGAYYFTPETALLIGNLAVALVASRTKISLTLKETVPLAEHTYELVFTPSRPLVFKAGQYVELTVPHDHADSRGIRRYFTLSSSPTDPTVRFGVKFYEPASTFKQRLRALKPGDSIVAGQLGGDFTLPRNVKRKLAFIAGGIGITPFHSQIEYLRERNEMRDIILFYSNAAPEKTSYRDDIEKAVQAIGLKTVYAYDGMGDAVPEGAVQSITPEVIRDVAPDYRERLFYISGPDSMVRDMKRKLHKMGVPMAHIKTDYFPGFA